MAAPEGTCDYTDSCGKCKTLEGQYRFFSTEQNLLVVHADRLNICAGKKDKVKKKKLQQLEKIVSAFRNSSGGQLLIHINGQRDDDRYLEHFDEFITRSFSDLIEDGQLYIKAYERRWLSELTGFQDKTDFLLLTIGASARISTVDFNTKVNNDIENIRPKALNIAEIRFNQPSTPTQAPVLRGLLDVQQLHENRRIEIKAFKPKPGRVAELLSNPSSLVDYIWGDLKLKENLTSLSKVIGGGSFYVGISEVERTAAGYKTKIPQIDGLLVSNIAEITQCIYTKVKETCQVLQGHTFSDVPNDLLHVKFHPLEGTNPSLYVLEVAIRFFDGVVFYDKEGPRAYEIKDNRIYRIDNTDWLSRFERGFKPSVL